MGFSKFKHISFVSIFIGGVLLFIRQVNLSAQSSAIITVNPSVTYQTITGWEGAAQIAHNASTYQFDNVHLWQNEVIDKLVNELGINRIRQEIRAGIENSFDWFSWYAVDPDARSSTYRDHWYEKINDDNNPFSVDSAIIANPNIQNFPGYNFSFLDHSIDHITVPMRNALTNRGESLYINLLLVDFNNHQGSSDVHFDSNSQEYAEFILAIFQHIKAKYGFVPDSVEITLEPENTSWNGADLGHGLYATQQRLAAFGFHPKFILPSVTNMGNAVTYFNSAKNAIASDLGTIISSSAFGNYIQSNISEVSYHRYGGVSDTNLQLIYDASQDGPSNRNFSIGTSMLEHINSGYQDLYKDLTIANNSAWQQFAYAFTSSDPNDGTIYYRIDITDPSNPVVAINNRSKYLRQYFNFIRRGAVRISASSNNSLFQPVAFINSTSNPIYGGSYVVVVNASTGGNFSINGLPGGRYGIEYTTGTGAGQWGVAQPDIDISTGQPLTATIPNSGVITVYSKSTVGPLATPPASNCPDPLYPNALCALSSQPNTNCQNEGPNSYCGPSSTGLVLWCCSSSSFITPTPPPVVGCVGDNTGLTGSCVLLSLQCPNPPLTLETSADCTGITAGCCVDECQSFVGTGCLGENTGLWGFTYALNPQCPTWSPYNWQSDTSGLLNTACCVPPASCGFTSATPAPTVFLIQRPPLDVHANCTGDEISSAIGCIPLATTTAFASFWLRWSLGVGGGVSLLLVIYAGFLYMSSKGDPEKIQEAKGFITAALGGITVLIFSVFILELLGVRILQIPGF
jgi:hypothetical protein